MTMPARKLGSITIGQAPRPDITPILDEGAGCPVILSNALIAKLTAEVL
jgi:hypothetical protein